LSDEPLFLDELQSLLSRRAAKKADAGGRIPLEGESFPQQWAYETSAARYNAVMCGRQSGKTSGARRRARRVLGIKPGSRVIYATLIRRNCRKLFWQPIKDELYAAGWTFKHNDTEMVMSLPNGSWMQALSCSGLDDLKTIRGDQADLFILDECQEPNDDVIEALTLKIVPPMLMKRGGMLDLLGTVPEVEPNVFSKCLDSPLWRAFGWTPWDNPYVPNEEIQRTCDETGIGPGHIVYEREIMGRRVKDPSKLAYEYVPATNDYKPGGVDFLQGQWRHSLGLDLGFQDRDAIVVLGWNRQDDQRRLYVRHTWQQNHLDVDQLADVVAEVVAQYHPNYIVGDHGGHGAVKVLETLRNRLGIQIERKPGDVMVSVGLVNDDLRTGRLMLEEGSELGSDLGRVQRTVDRNTNRVVINKKGYHSDLSEALRYAHCAARHWASKAPPPELTRDERRDMQWQKERKRQANPWR
jgi:hypothetical protein